MAPICLPLKGNIYSVLSFLEIGFSTVEICVWNARWGMLLRPTPWKSKKKLHHSEVTGKAVGNPRKHAGV